MVAKNKKLLNSLRYRNANGSFNFQPADTAALESDPATGQITAVLPAGVKLYNNPSELPLVGNDTGQIAFVDSNNRMYIWTGSGWISITTVNRAPQITVEPNAAYTFAIDGTPIVLSLDALDSDQTPVAWSYNTSGLGNIATVSQDSSVFTITPSISESDAGSFTMTFIASDGINTDTAQSVFTLTFMSEYWNDVVLNIGTSSVPGRQNSTFIDRSIFANTVAAVGTPTQTSFHPYLDNYGINFDGTGDYLTLNTSTELTGEFTLELWLYLNDVASNHYIISQAINSSVTSNWGINGSSGFGMQLYGGARGNQNGTLAYNVASLVGSWNHLALEYNGSNSYEVFVNGVSIGTQPGVTSPWHSAGIDAFTVIGAYWYNTAASLMNGVISNLCITKGLRKYGTNFTPPTDPFTTDANTALLIAQSNRFVENSNSYPITPYGDVSITSYTPFGQETEYAIAENKGSFYNLNGGNQYITFSHVPLTSVSGTAFTVEMWVYPMQYGNDYGHLLHRNWSGNNNFLWTINSSGYFSLWFNHTGLRMDNSTRPVRLKSWSHIALVRDGSNFAFLLNGEVIQTGTYSGNIDTSRADPLYVGVYPGYNIGSVSHNAYFSDLKISSVAQYDPTGSVYTLPTAPVGNANATLYLPMDDASIFDTTANSRLTIFGNVATSATQTKYADTAIYFDGTGDYLTAGDIDLGSNDFTIETWFYQTASGQYSSIFSTTINYGTGNSLRISTGPSNNTMQVASASSGLLNASTSFSNNVWNHVALTRSGSTLRLFLNGIQVGTASNSTNFVSDNFIIGDVQGAGAPYNFTGYMENFQILRGVAKYTTNFTPPTNTQNLQNQLTS